MKKYHFLKDDNKLSLPSELFFGNPQLPANSDNHFIPVSLQQPTTIFAYSMSTKLYSREFDAMKKLVLEGGIEGCCEKEKELLDPNDNLIKVTFEVEENGIPAKYVVRYFLLHNLLPSEKHVMRLVIYCH